MIFGYLCALLVGISLGALGMGGSILTIPIMVYLMHVSPMDATGYSLFVVGLTSSIGGAKYIRSGLVDLRTAGVFALPSVVSVFITRTYLVPSLPETLRMGSLALSRDQFVLFFFAVLMTIVGYQMIRNRSYAEIQQKEFHWTNYIWLIFLGAIAGLLTGLLGVGGGFIIIPSLVLLAKTPIRMSVGTSLLIIALNSWIGFAGEMLVRKEPVDISFLLLFALFSAAGIFVGFSLASHIASHQLKKLFGWLVLLVGVGIFINEFLIS